nr:atp synthase subunit f, mitochondrial [Quercus suber]
MVSSLVPPKVASPSAIGGAADAARMQKVVSFYEKLPRGPAPAPKASGLLSWYSLKYMTGRNASAAPIFHVVGGLLLIGYAQNYYFHLRHHKNNAH